MALRVLLADESSTIKKVMQLALQDYGVEVRSVPVGIDVLMVTQDFKPDIIFVDVLLSKKSGYEVSAELKTNTHSHNIPVVLMWSSFMELDQPKFDESGANAKLEKPFDAETLRNLVQKLVLKTQSQAISSFLQFPNMPDFKEEQPPFQIKNQNELSSSPEEILVDETFDPSASIETDEIIDEEFSQVPLHFNSSDKEKKITSDVVDSWSTTNTKALPDSKFEEDIIPDFASKYLIPTEKESSNLTLNQSLKNRVDSAKKSQTLPPPSHRIEVLDDIEINEIQFEELEDLTQKKRDISEISLTQIPLTSPPPKVDLAKVTHATSQGLNKIVEDQLKGTQMDPVAEKILREEARSVLENIAWKLVPDIAERIIREEIQKLLREVEKSI